MNRSSMNPVRRFFVLSFAILCLSLTTKTSKAGHFGLVELSYRWVSDSTYEFTAIAYRFCVGFTAGMPNQLFISGNSASKSLNSQFTMNRLNFSGQNFITPPNLLSCYSGTATCFEEYEYRGTVTLPGRASDWKFTYSTCCLPNELDNLSGSAQTECLLNNLDFPYTTSPQSSVVWHDRQTNHTGVNAIDNIPVVGICEDRHLFIDQSAYHPDGDSVVYELVGTLGSASFTNGYTYDSPLPYDTSIGFNLDSSTGVFDFKAIHDNAVNTPTYGVFIRATEYRKGSFTTPKVVGISYRVAIFVIAADSNCTDNEVTFTGTVGTSGYKEQMECADTSFVIGLEDYVKCNSIDTDASSILMIDTATGDTLSLMKAAALNCSGADIADSIEIWPTQPIATGTYYLTGQIGTDGDVFYTECGTPLDSLNDTILVTIDSFPVAEFLGSPDGLGGYLNHLDVQCGANTILIELTEPMRCSSVDPLGSEFSAALKSNGNPVLISSVTSIGCTDDLTQTLKIVFGQLFTYDDMELSWNKGIDGDIMVNFCGFEMDSGMMDIIVPDDSVDLGPDHEFCEEDSWSITLDAGAGYSSYVWNTGDTSRLLTVSSPGTYSVIALTDKQCSVADTVEITEVPCVSGIDNATMTEVEIFPNPATNELTVRFGQLFNGQLMIYSFDGKVVRTENVQGNQAMLDVSSIQPGTYLIRLIDINGIQVGKSQFVKANP